MKEPIPSTSIVAKESARYGLTPEDFLKYQIEVSNRLALLSQEEELRTAACSETQWKSLKEIVSVSAKAHLTKRLVSKKPWLSQETMSLLERKRMVRWANEK
jgi:hypothetical protein